MDPYVWFEPSSPSKGSPAGPESRKQPAASSQAALLDVFDRGVDMGLLRVGRWDGTAILVINPDRQPHAVLAG
jgi:hypothetical protein